MTATTPPMEPAVQTTMRQLLATLDVIIAETARARELRDQMLAAARKSAASPADRKEASRVASK